MSTLFRAIVRASDQVIASRCPVVIGDLGSDPTPGLGESPVFGSSISVPMLVNDQLIGTLSLAAAEPHRFERVDEHLLGIIAGQIGVAVQNTRLHDVVRRGKWEWEHTFDAISDPIAVFDSLGHLLRGNTALAILLGRPVTDLPRTSCHSVGFCGGSFPSLRGGRGGDRIAPPARFEVTLADRRHLQCDHLSGDRRRRGPVGRPGRQERDRGNPLGAPAPAVER